MFVPLGLFPGSSHPNAPDPNCPIQRQSGVFGFTDTMGTADPNDDREYFVACRSDGVFLIDATPVAGAGGSGASTVTIPTGNSVTFVPEPDWRYLGDPYVAYPPPPGIPVVPGIPTGADPGLDDQLHGYVEGPPQLPRDISRSYCTDPARYPYPYSTRHTTNREAVVWCQAGSSPATHQFWIYSVSTLHAGIWVIPVSRDANGILVVDSASPGAWHTGSAAQPIGRCHMVYLDPHPNRPFLWITDHGSHAVRAVRIGAGGVLDPVLAFHYQAQEPGAAPGTWLTSEHDAMPVGDYLLATYTQRLLQVPEKACIDIFDLARIFTDQTWPPVTLTSLPDLRVLHGIQNGSHSTHLDLTSTPEPSLWTLIEDTATGQINNIARFRFNGLFQQPTPREVHNRVPEGIPQSPPPAQVSAPVHHLRAVGREGFGSQYNSGIVLLDLSATSNPNPPTATNMTVLGSYDTSPIAHPPNETIPIRFDLNKFLGTWDISPWQDSGLVYASGGEYGGIVFQVTEGHLNRYWSATPFPALAGAAGLFPRLKVISGPPRVGRTITLVDANKDTYPSTRDSTPVAYRYTLYWSTVEPTTSTPWLPPWLAQKPNANQGQFHLVPEGEVTQLTNQVLGDDRFEWKPDELPRGTRVFLQLIVEEVDVPAVGPPAPTGRWAGSRGTWFGIAKE